MAGNIHIITPPDNFLKVSKDIIYNDAVDFASLGIYVKVLALGKRWNLNISGLAKLLHISTDKVRKHFAVLESAGYLRRSRAQDEKGHFVGWDYEVSSVPFTDLANYRHRKNTDIGKIPTSGFSEGNIENISSNKDVNSINREYKSARSVKPSLEEVKAYCEERGNTVDAVTFWEHYESNGWRVGNAPMKDWKAAVRTWERRQETERKPKTSTPAPDKSQVVTDVNQFWNR
mgnify:CR=1 FL=1